MSSAICNYAISPALSISQISFSTSNNRYDCAGLGTSAVSPLTTALSNAYSSLNATQQATIKTLFSTTGPFANIFAPTYTTNITVVDSTGAFDAFLSFFAIYFYPICTNMALYVPSVTTPITYTVSVSKCCVCVCLF